MKNRIRLLPYRCQIIGLCLFFAAFLGLSVSIFGTLKTTPSPRWLDVVLGIIMYLSFATVLFSQEKNENDKTVQIRKRTIVTVATLCLVVVLLAHLISLFLSPEAYDTFKSWRQQNLWDGKLVTRFAIFYWLAFKIQVWCKS